MKIFERTVVLIERLAVIHREIIMIISTTTLALLVLTHLSLTGS